MTKIEAICLILLGGVLFYTYCFIYSIYKELIFSIKENEHKKSLYFSFFYNSLNVLFLLSLLTYGD